LAPEAFYENEARGERFIPSPSTRGPWDPDAQHAGPPAALLGRAIERCEPRDGMRVGRITCEILRPVPLEPLTVEASVVRPGRSVELLEASLAGPNGELMRARAWRLETGEHALQLDDEERPPGPAEGVPSDFPETGHEFGYHDANEYSFVRGGFRKPGPATVWMCARVPLVEGEEPTPLQRVLVAADSGNGVSAALDWRTYHFINTELTVHLMRPLEGEWVCLDAVTRVDGLGLAETTLWDERGRIGRAAQTLLVRRRMGED
jgi:acyl-Coa thioesterase superfamily protein/acyl-CoA thioesterase superfamily protein